MIFLFALIKVNEYFECRIDADYIRAAGSEKILISLR